MTTTRIDLLRHGLPEGDHCFRGQVDFALTEKGMQQMFHAVGEKTAYDRVISSPLSRCYDFASAFAAQHELEVTADPGFLELDFGDWDGQPKQQVWDNDSTRLSEFWSNPWHSTPPGGESLEVYEQRIITSWQQVLESYAGQSILLVTHGGVIKQLIRHLLELPRTAGYIQRLEIPYAARVKISVYHDQDGTLWPQLHWPGTE